MWLSLLLCVGYLIFYSLYTYNCKKIEKYNNKKRQEIKQLVKIINNKIINHIQLFNGEYVDHMKWGWFYLNGVRYDFHTDGNFILTQDDNQSFCYNKTYQEDILQLQDMNKKIDQIIKMKAFI